MRNSYIVYFDNEPMVILQKTEMKTNEVMLDEYAKKYAFDRDRLSCSTFPLSLVEI